MSVDWQGFLNTQKRQGCVMSGKCELCGEHPLDCNCSCDLCGQHPLDCNCLDDLLTFERAMAFLRQGFKITRASFDPEDRKALGGTTDKPRASFYLTLFDILAEDWVVINE